MLAQRSETYLGTPCKLCARVFTAISIAFSTVTTCSIPVVQASTAHHSPMRSAAMGKQRTLSQRAMKAASEKKRVVVPSALAPEVSAFHQLKSFASVDTSLAIAPTRTGFGLVCEKSAVAGEVLMRVPRKLAFMLCYDEGLQLPEGAWPRLREGASREEALPWDLLFALALMDGLAGDGGQFWGAWCQAVLPPPEALTLPMCWTQQRLQELQHTAIQEGAVAQQARLQSLFPALCDPVDADSCSWIAWAFACVRSRAFKVAEETFVMVPFLDLANHSSTPNANFRLQGDHFELFALKELQADEEVTISYTGEEGYTNQRLMAQYGFVPVGGNPADRITFDTAAAAPATGLLLTRMQSALGDQVFLAAVSGQDPYLHAVLRSLPWVPESAEELKRLEALELAAAEAADRAAESTDNSGSTQQQHSQDSPDIALAQQLQQQVLKQLGDCKTSLDEDMVELRAALAEREAPDGRLLAALQYRIERKQVLNKCLRALNLYLA